MAFSNPVANGNVAAIITTAGAVSFGYDSLATFYPAALQPLSLTGTTTITLPPARMTLSTVGGGAGTALTFLNTSAQTLTFAAASGDTIQGSTATLAQNASVTFVADSANKLWNRLSA